jgi:hypothetical protein
MRFCRDCPPTVNAVLMLCADNFRYYQCSICRRFYDANEIRPMTTPEGMVLKEITSWLDSRNAYYFRPVQSGLGRRGVDLYVCWGGLFLAVEVKRPGGRAKKFQERILDEVRACRGLAVCVDSLKALQEYLSIVA